MNSDMLHAILQKQNGSCFISGLKIDLNDDRNKIFIGQKRYVRESENNDYEKYFVAFKSKKVFYCNGANDKSRQEGCFFHIYSKNGGKFYLNEKFNSISSEILTDDDRRLFFANWIMILII